MEAWLDERLGVTEKPGVWWALPAVRAAAGITRDRWAVVVRSSAVVRRGAGSRPPAADPDGVAAVAGSPLPRGVRAGVGPGHRAVRDDLPAAGARRRSRRSATSWSGSRARTARSSSTSPAASLPPEDSPAPPRLLAMWDSTLLAYDDRSRIDPAGLPQARHPEQRRRAADAARRRLRRGRLAAGRRRHRGDRVPRLPPTRPGRGSRPRHARCAAFLADRDPAVYRRYAHWWAKLPNAEVRML